MKTFYDFRNQNWINPNETYSWCSGLNTIAITIGFYC